MPSPAVAASLWGLAVLVLVAAPARAPAPTRGPEAESLSVQLELVLPSRAGVFFASVADADVTPSGDVVVLDRLNKTLYRFAPGGMLRDSVGRPGRGPGEFGHPVQVEVGPGGEIAVADLAASSVSHWAPDGSLIGATRLPGPPWGLWWTAKGLYARTYRQRLLDVAVSYVPVAPGADSAGAPVVTFMAKIEDRSGLTRGVSCAFCAAAMTPAGQPVVTAPDTAYRVSLIRDGGEVERVWSRRGVPAVRRSESEIEEIRGHVDRAHAGPFDASRFRYKPRLAAIEVDGRGRLWALRSAKDGEPAEVDVFGPTGGYVLTLVFDRSLSRIIVRRGRVLGIGGDAAGEPTVYVYRIREPTG